MKTGGEYTGFGGRQMSITQFNERFKSHNQLNQMGQEQLMSFAHGSGIKKPMNKDGSRMAGFIDPPDHLDRDNSALFFDTDLYIENRAVSKLQSSKTLNVVDSNRSIQFEGTHTSQKKKLVFRRKKSITLPKIKSNIPEAYKQVVLPEVLAAKDLEKKYGVERPELHIDSSSSEKYDEDP